MTKTISISISQEDHDFLKSRLISPSRLFQKAVLDARNEIEKADTTKIQEVLAKIQNMVSKRLSE